MSGHWRLGLAAVGYAAWLQLLFWGHLFGGAAHLLLVGAILATLSVARVRSRGESR